MRSTIFGLSVPLLLLAAGFAVMMPLSAAQETTTYEVSGRILSDEGKPIGGAQVSVNTEPKKTDAPVDWEAHRAFTTSDKEGYYTVKIAAGKGWVNAWYDEWRQSAGREIVVEGPLSNIDLVIKTPPPKTAIITGIVLDPAGNPVAGAEVQLQYACCYIYETTATPEPAIATAESDEPASSKMSSRPAIMPPHHDDYQRNVTDADGRFTFKSYGGPRQLHVTAKGYASETLRVEAKENETTEVTIKLHKVPARDAILTGKVVDKDTGLPIKGAQVNVRSLEWGRYADARTGADGAYRIETVPGWTEISVYYYPEPPTPMPLANGEKPLIEPALVAQYFQYSDIKKLQSGANAIDVSLAAKPKPTIALIGYVVDPDAKKGVEGARVHVWNQETGDWGEAVTDKTGSFRILVRPGQHSANAWKEGHIGGSQTFLVTNEGTQRIDLIMPKGQTRYAPCYDESDCGPIVAYADGARFESGEVHATTAAAEESPVPPPAPARVAAKSANSDQFDAGGPNNAQTYTGGGGGLPEYPGSSPEPQTPGEKSAPRDTTPTNVPGAGLALGLAFVALAAIVIGRRRG